MQKAAIKGTTDALTSFITKTPLASMPAAVVAQAKRCLVDGFGVILAGSTVKMSWKSSGRNGPLSASVPLIAWMWRWGSEALPALPARPR